ncbi:DUF4185 domain-containing protein [Actinomycetes bacterium M1A6_2h]
MRFVRGLVSATVSTLAVASLTVLTSSPATAEPCGGVPGTGITGVGLPFQQPSGVQGPVPYYSGANTNTVAWVTGPASANNTFERFGISGTDLGISWDNGAGQTLVAFGDTIGNCTVPGGEWRHQVLLRSNDSNLSDGMSLDEAVSTVSPRFATQLLPTLGLAPVETTVIPTAAIAVDGVQYMSFMSVRAWNGSTWSTNYSGIATSRDNGRTWFSEPSTLRFNSGVPIPGTEQLNARFQQAAFVRGNDGKVYQYGTPNGRLGSVFVSRVAPDAMLDLNRYEYFTGAGWSSDLNAAAPIVREPVGELSVAWNAYLGKYVMLHGNDIEGRIVLRTAPSPEGPWSGPTTLVVNSELGGYPGSGLYAPYIHPKSSGSDLYFTVSQYSSYNVILMHTNLAAL